MALSRLVSAPSPARYFFTAPARRMPSARLYSVVPRSSAWPASTTRRNGVFCRHSQSLSSCLRVSGARVASSKPKWTAFTSQLPNRRDDCVARIACALHTLLTHAFPSPQSASARHASSAAQRPPEHLLPLPQSCAAVSSVHSGRHFSCAHFWPAGQSLFEAHCGLSLQSASRHTGRSSLSAQFEASRHSLQKPPKQTWS